MNIKSNSFLNVSKTPGELNQAYIRLVIVSVIVIYTLCRSNLTGGPVIPDYFYVALSYTLLSMVFLAWSYRCIGLPDDSMERVIFRLVTAAGDNITLAVGMIIGGRAGDPLFFIFLWVAFGNGIRYGINYLILSSCLSFICFSFVVYFTPTWNSSEVIVKSIGLLFSLIILPIYVIKLLGRLTEALEEAREANRLKQMFIANMNHELRTPLNSIIQLTDLIKTYDIRQEAYRLLSMVGSSANALLDVVNRILDISKMEAGEYVLIEHEFNMPVLLHDIYNIISPQCYKKNLKLNFLIDPATAADYYGASEQISQVIVNLLGNAVKFTDSGQVSFSIRVKEKRYDRDFLEILVMDTGIGIPEEFKPHIFKPFAQADQSITRRYGGTGLGITITRQLVTALRGTVQLDSKEGVGTIFKVTLPVKKLKTVKTSPVIQHNEELQQLIVYSLSGTSNSVDFKTICNAYNLEVCGENELQHKLNLYEKQDFPDKAGILFMDYDETVKPGLDLDKLAGLDMPMVCIDRNKPGDRTYNGVVIPIPSSSDVDSIRAALMIAALFTLSDHRLSDELRESSRVFNILVAEDDQTLQLINQTLFDKVGHKLTLADNGAQALELLQDRKYDIAILDLHMPELSGIEVAQMYYASCTDNRTPLVLLTADNTELAMNEAREAGFAEILSKPIRPAVLLEHIYRILGHHDSATEADTASVNYQDSPQDESDYLVDMKTIESLFETTGYLQLKQILDGYDKDTVARIGELESNIRGGNYHSYRDILHALIGSAGAVGATSLVGLIRQAQRVTEAEFRKSSVTRSLSNDLHSIHKRTMKTFSRMIRDRTTMQLEN